LLARLACALSAQWVVAVWYLKGAITRAKPATKAQNTVG